MPQNTTSKESVSRKLLVLFLGLSGAMILTASIAFVAAGYLVFREVEIPQNLTLASEYISDPRFAGELAFDPSRAERYLAHLAQYLPGMRHGMISTMEGEIIAERKTDNFKPPGAVPPPFNRVFGDIEWRREIMFSGTPVARVYVRLEPRFPNAYLRGAALAGAFALMVFLLLIQMLLHQLRKQLILPINNLISTSKQISTERDYSVRAEKLSDDELGKLADTFNNMVRRVEARERLLTSAREKAETATESAQYQTEETRRANTKLEREVHERAQVERQLTEFKNYLVNIFNSMPSTLITVDGNFMVTQWNREASRISGTPTGDAMYSRITHAYPFLQNYLDLITDALVERRTHQLEQIPLKIPGEQDKRYYDITIYPLSDTGYPGAVIRMDDVTDRMHLEEMMVQTEKMVTVGGLAAGMAHEINNPLGAIVHGTQNIKRRLSQDLPRNKEIAYRVGTNLNVIRSYMKEQDILKFVDNIQDAGERAAKIVSNMLQFSRRTDSHLVMSDLGEVLQRSIEISANDLDLKQGLSDAEIEIKTDFSSGISVPCAASEIEQVVLNLIKNGVQAIQERLKTDNDAPGLITIRLQLQGDYALIEVADNGIGMNEEARKRIFEPFFTTKDVGHGTGLGLSVSYFIISTNHRGRMEVRSEPGEGTRFLIYLPVQADRRLQQV